jgi:mRNA-degrading endonuclease RelE of RelBE toxin-antitoxin system
MFLGKEVRVFMRDEAKQSFLELKKRTDHQSQSILNSIERVISILKENPQFGDPLKKELIPKKFKEQGIKNLYRAELSNFWRMLYTIDGNQIEIFLFMSRSLRKPHFLRCGDFLNIQKSQTNHRL